MFSGVERHASFCKSKHYFDKRKHIFINHVANEFQRTRKVYKRFILNIPVLQNKRVFSQTCMIFITSDEKVLVTTTGLSWPAYEKRDNSVRSCSPFLSMFWFTTFGGNTCQT
ncbi:hypothetical protein HanXRQr2_Chr03g0119591 [Helianthus annuus]|uniref:Uncharacterized protein n=1 Tax=Helianthus annuus TaxID=4232 RepID=A0A9K3JIF6_HELAN|nr:hypothetical protein HanXRQr2_Chr03g0119591 [Helianthus annuus]KAJ0944378.1 hypothetical protein HanPSC8_Chr03g0116101 [Helianthus annuus]